MTFYAFNPNMDAERFNALVQDAVLATEMRINSDGRIRCHIFPSSTAQSGEPTGAGEVVPTAHADNAEQKSSAQETST